LVVSFKASASGYGLRIGALTVLLVSLTCPAHAEEKSSREREALRRTQQSLRQTQEERDALAGEKATLAQDKDKLSSALQQTSAKVKGAESRAAAARARIDQVEASLKDKDKALAESQAREADLQARLTQAQAAMAEKTALTSTLTGMLKAAKAEQTILAAQNKALYDTGLALIDLYRSDSPSAWVKTADTALGLREVRVENLAEAFRTKLDAARYNAPSTAAQAPATAP
jgi:chromosome segregation ATPase